MSSSFSASSFSSRKLLLQTTPRVSTGSPIPSVHAGTKEPESYIDANVIMVLSVLICALICVLVLNSIIRCALGYSNRLARDSGNNRPVQLVANTGIKKRALKTFPVVTYSSGGLKLPGLDTECVICLSEFAQGERIRILPKCNHGFHIKCIGKWLSSHSTCPTCRHCLIETCEKIINAGSSQPRSLVPLSQPPHSSTIAPLEHEGIIRNVVDIC